MKFFFCLLVVGFARLVFAILSAAIVWLRVYARWHVYHTAPHSAYMHGLFTGRFSVYCRLVFFSLGFA
uniref:Uncharacterized protein n=1 Tax=Anopheles darlingi TaxID=43151 RepID=A0A2M4DM05_ANODA